MVKQFKLKKGFNSCTNEQYHSNRTFYSSSALKVLLENVPLFHKKYILNEKIEEPVNHNFTFGTFVHTLLLEPHLVEKEFTFFSGSKSTKEFEDFKEKNKEKTILTNTAWNNGLFLQQTVEESPYIEYIRGGEAEKTFCGQIDNMPIKVRADYIKDNYILDVKTTSANIFKDNGEVNLSKVADVCANYKYALSAALYLDMFKKEKKELTSFIFWFINKHTGKHCLVEASDEFLDYGRAQYKKAIQIFKECKANNTWDKPLPKVFPKY